MNLKLSLTASMILGEMKEVQPQNKQDFFTIKKTTRKMKRTKQNEKETPVKQAQPLDFNIDQCKIIKRLQNLDVKQLHHTLAETQDTEVTLQFKNKQPRKKKLSSKIFTHEHMLRSGISNDIFQNSSEKVNQQVEMYDSMIFEHQNIIKKSSIFQPKCQKENSLGQSAKFQHQTPRKINRTLTSLFENKITLSEEIQEVQISINDFYIVKQIGQGTYSKVYMVVHKKTGFISAMKVLEKNLMKNLKVQQNAIRQIKILTCLSSHPNIATLYGSFSDQKYIYLIMELCTDGDVHQKIKKLSINKEPNNKADNKIKLQKQHKKKVEIISILKQICQGLKQLHENNVMHRDIKPENILITMGTNIKLSDFGWAVHNPKDNLRKTLCGTPLYLAPQFITNCKYNDAIDIWSLGIMTYQMFTNELPFKIKSAQDLIKIVQQQINFDKITCPVIKDFCQRALVRNVNSRADIWQLLQHEVFKIYDSPQ